MLKIHNKSDAVRVGAYKQYSASFEKADSSQVLFDAEVEKPQQEIGFTIPAAVSKSDVEKHFTELNEIQFRGSKLRYVRNSLRVKGGRKSQV